ncbi:Methionine--tRNA ligase [uncultured Desulfatiglans sp.]|uniref:Methionine--tRNA ligase n=1 Tax=Uncultured Desulfatiglans sp. TaxID=1748965 RepID=A0A653A204_UNCDX|nr:Methionine--tRNA ligase [uncultured Desulfatiglans sp.]
MSTFYITTPIYYVNAEPHLGHAYSTIVADVLNRFHLLRGEKTFFLTGTDEHGDKIVKAAEAAGESPADYVDRISAMFRLLWPKLNISHSHFIRTTDPAHKAVVQGILTRVKDRGDIYFSEYEGLYCYGCERFYTERELVDGKCPDHQTPPEVIREANYFFRMSRYQDWLIDHIERNPDFIRPERYRNEVLSFLKEPLEDLCISRPKSRLEWGIPLPFDDRFVTYVWFDALINYISALDYPDGEDFKTFWPAAQHIIAKDILKPHGIYWPCMLKSAGIEPYRHLNVHGYWIIDKGKMSKSLGNVVKPLDMVDRYGLDAFRYFLMREMVFGLDSDFSEEGFIARVNADLANDLGNLVSRSTTMVNKFFDGRYPDTQGPTLPIDDTLKGHALAVVGRYTAFMLEPSFHKALMAVWEVINQVNKYIDETAPWVLAKSDRGRLGTVIAHILETLRIVSGLLWPFMPESAEKIQAQLGLPRSGRDLTLSELEGWDKKDLFSAIHTGPALFPRIEARKETPAGAPKPDKKDGPLPEKAVISYEDFEKVDLRVGTILTAEVIPKSKKLLKLTVDAGGERTVVAGIKEHYSPEDLLGKQVLIVANLAPATLMGVESQGMILAASDESGLHILLPERPKKPGTRVK